MEVIASAPKRKPWALLAWLAAGASMVLVYYPALSGPWLLDDSSGITSNSEFRHFTLRNIFNLFRGHRDVRAYDHHPVPGFTALVDYQWSGNDPFGFHLSNLLFHWLTAGAILLLLLTVLRRAMPALGEWKTVAIGACAMTIWALHPFSTMAIGYVTARQETLMVLFYVLAMYALARGWEGAAFGLAITSFLSKEVAVTLPGALLLIDWASSGQSFIDSFRRRLRFYLFLTGTWLFLCYWHWRGGRSQHVLSTGMPLASSTEYFKAQCGVIVDYASKLVWPAKLQFYPYIRAADRWTEWVPQAIAIALYIAVALYSVRVSRWLAAALIFPLLVLLPTSSFIPIPYEPAMEYRMYLPSAALAGLFTVAVWRWIHPLWAKRAILASVAIALGVTSHLRSRDYTTAIRLFEQQVSVDPKSLTGLEALAGTYLELKMNDRAERSAGKLLDWSLEQKSQDFAARAFNLLGAIANDKRDYELAKDYFRRAIDASGSMAARVNLATVQIRLYDLDPAEKELAKVLSETPDHPDALLMIYEAKMSRKDYIQAEAALRRFLAYYPERDDLDVQYTRILALKRKAAETLE